MTFPFRLLQPRWLRFSIVKMPLKRFPFFLVGYQDMEIKLFASFSLIFPVKLNEYCFRCWLCAYDDMSFNFPNSQKMCSIKVPWHSFLWMLSSEWSGKIVEKTHFNIELGKYSTFCIYLNERKPYRCRHHFAKERFPSN